MQNLFRFRELSEFDDKKRIEAVVDVFPIRTQGDVSHNLRQSGSVLQGHHHHFYGCMLQFQRFQTVVFQK
ncbi:hypothetical protein NC652_041802 [Populus alba x Populus x berolinensis]|nr:hypothetical protein NC652_041802 [Populus alba x Populus x berolinensis]